MKRSVCDPTDAPTWRGRAVRGVVGLAIAALPSAGCATGSGPSMPGGGASEVEPDPTTLPSLRWLSGRWVGEDGDALSEELWTEGRGGTMMGVSRTVVDGETIFFEYLRIERREASVVFIASPKGRTPTEFALESESERRAVFVNEAHDFPQRIIYWREGNTLHATLEGEQGGEAVAVQWTWERRR